MRYSAVSLLLMLFACGAEPVSEHDYRRYQGQRQEGASGADLSDWLPGTCTADRQRAFVQHYLDYGYYYNKQMPTIDYRSYPHSVTDLFYELTQRSVADDPFSFVTSQQNRDDGATGAARGRYGLSWLINQDNELRINNVDPNGPAYEAGLRRGDHVVQINDLAIAVFEWDGVKYWQDQPLRAAIAADSMTLLRQRDGTSEPLTLTRGDFSSHPIAAHAIVTNPYNSVPVGYLHLSTFAQQDAEKQLAKVLRDQQAANVSELVLDLRYNSGGSAYLANLLVTAIKGQAALGQKMVSFKHNANLAGWDQDYLGTQTLAYDWPDAPAEMPLFAGLQRLYVLTGPGTCSASELVVLALQGLDMPVILVGQPGCGKPLFSYRFDNCTLSYAPIAGLYVNAKDETLTPGQGMAVQMAVTEDAKHDFTDPNERLLQQALYHQANGDFLQAPIGVSLLKNDRRQQASLPLYLYPDGEPRAAETDLGVPRVAP